MNTLLKFLENRRSAKIALLGAPGPDASELGQILKVAARVPDHKRMVPWRFIVFDGDSRAKFGDRLAEILVKESEEAPSTVRLETERQRFLRAPLVVAVVSRITDTRVVPEWEQVLSAGAAAFNLCLAANALGYGTAWVTEWYAFSRGADDALGLGDGERVAGFVYVGTEQERQPDRERPDMEAIVTHWQG
ncbi:MAG: nitroreductase [Hyphomicrobiaceae bacterium]